MRQTHDRTIFVGPNYNYCRFICNFKAVIICTKLQLIRKFIWLFNFLDEKSMLILLLRKNNISKNIQNDEAGGRQCGLHCHEAGKMVSTLCSLLSTSAIRDEGERNLSINGVGNWARVWIRVQPYRYDWTMKCNPNSKFIFHWVFPANFGSWISSKQQHKQPHYHFPSVSAPFFSCMLQLNWVLLHFFLFSNSY